MSAHTPGPWVVITPKTNNYRHEIHGEKGPRGAERVVARCPAPNGRATDAEHNAKLIAAAPDLADALEALLATCSDPCRPEEHAALAQTTAALRKAGRLP